MMSEVEWLEISTGLTQIGAKDLHISGDGWVPLCWLEIEGNPFKTLLSDLSKYIKIKTTSIVKMGKNEKYDSINNMVILGMSEDDKKIIEVVLPLFKYISIRYSASGMMELSYSHPTSYPNSKEWVWTGDIDADYHYDDPLGAGTTSRDTHPVPGPRGPPSPGPCPPGPLLPGPPSPGPPSPPPPMPGPTPFLEDDVSNGGGPPSPR